MKNLIKKATASLLAFAVALSSVYISGPVANIASATATGIKGDANADGVVNEADLAVYEDYLLNDADIDSDISQDMDIDADGRVYAKTDYLAVKRYLAGDTATVEPYSENCYTYSGNSWLSCYSGYNFEQQGKEDLDCRITVNYNLCDEFEIVWCGELPSGLTFTDDGYIRGCADLVQEDQYLQFIVLGKNNGEYVGAYHFNFNLYAPAYIIDTEDGEFIYDNHIKLLKPGTYNIVSRNPDEQIESYETICVDGNYNGSGKLVLNLNGMDIIEKNTQGFISNYWNINIPDVDIVLNGTNKIDDGCIEFNQSTVTIYGQDGASLILKNNELCSKDLVIKGGNVSLYNWAGAAATITNELIIDGGNLKAVFDYADQGGFICGGIRCAYSICCDEIIYRKGNLDISGHSTSPYGAYGAITSYSGDPYAFYVSPSFCDVEVSVSDDGTNYSAINGSPFSDVVHSPSASVSNAVTATIPDGAVDIFDLVDGYTDIKFTTTSTYRYQVTIEGDGAVIKQNGSVIDDNIFVVNGGEKLPSDLSVAAKDGWAIDSITASVNGGTPAVITDITDIEIVGDTVITINTSDVVAPVINGIEDGEEYCIDATFTVADDSDVTVEVDGVEIFADTDGNYTVIGMDYGHHIVVTDADGNVTEYTITVYSDHPSISNAQYTDENTHKGICDACGADVFGQHNYSDWTEIIATGKHERQCADCLNIEEEDHSFNEWEVNTEGDAHIRTCDKCGLIQVEGHFFSNWTDNSETGKHERECAICEYAEESEHDYIDAPFYEDWEKHYIMCGECGAKTYNEHTITEWACDDNMWHSRHCEENCGFRDVMPHNFSDWIDNHETGKHERVCGDCGYKEEAEHELPDWIPNEQTGKHEKKCAYCSHTVEAEHSFSEWANNPEKEKHERKCADCGLIEEAEHVSDKWTNNPETNKHEAECEICDDKVEVSHKFSGGVYVEDNHHKMNCTYCDAVATETCEGLWVIVKDPTCTENGKEEMICEICGEKHVKEIDKLPHQYVSGVCEDCEANEPTIGESTSDNPNTGVALGASVALIPAALLMLTARPKARKKSK